MRLNNVKNHNMSFRFDNDSYKHIKDLSEELKEKGYNTSISALINLAVALFLVTNPTAESIIAGDNGKKIGLLQVMRT